jgi:transcriptional antiterminator NusG
MSKNWYVVHTYSGYENKVKTNLEKRVESMGMQDKIFRVLVPMEEEIEMKNGKKKVVQRKIFPGYVLVEMIVTDDSWYVVRNTPGVTGFVAEGTKPIPLQESETKLILRQMGLEEPRTKIDIAENQNVKVSSGPFENFVGKVLEVNHDRQKLKVLISMFGRETPIELGFDQIERM